MVRILYQGELSPSQYLRALIPMPPDEYLERTGTINATFCYATPIDPQDPGSYTRSGLEITFRPHVGQIRAMRMPQFLSHARSSEEVTSTTNIYLRNDAQKWETTLHATKTFRGTSLLQPVFDIHYNARSSGGAARDAKKMRYALVVTVRSPQYAQAV